MKLLLYYFVGVMPEAVGYRRKPSETVLRHCRITRKPAICLIFPYMRWEN